MKYAINGDLERHLLNGCTIITKESINYNVADGEITHVLLKCPKDYKLDHVKNDDRPVSYIGVEWGLDFSKPSWFDGTWYYSNMAHAKKSFREHLQEDRKYHRLKEKQSNNK